MDETRFGGDDPIELAVTLARAKARAGAAMRPASSASTEDDFPEIVSERVVLGADTVVALREGAGWRVLGKPTDPDDARATLRLLRGREHLVVTGVAVVRRENERFGHEETRVRMRDLSDAEIEGYVATGDPLDKAGSYAIQHPMNLVRSIEGPYDNVVGLPMDLVRRLLSEA